MGHPALCSPAVSVAEEEWPCLPELVQDLEDTLLKAEGVGLAAPQIGVGWRVVLFGFEASARYPDAAPIPRTLLINPVWRPLGG
jgi:peptide deformylase